MKRNVFKQAMLLLLVAMLALPLAGCRTRTTGTLPEGETLATDASSEQAAEAMAGSLPSAAELTEFSRDELNDEHAAEADPYIETLENPEAKRKEYDENATVEVVPGTDRMLHGEGEGEGAFADSSDAERTVSKLNDDSEETATQVVAAQEAEQVGVAEDAEEADSAMTYFTVLLRDRLDALYECQRLKVYWETAEDHVTIFKTSPEHHLILSAGAYDVSARLLQENLLVDDGWISRKNPGVVVKVVNTDKLGSGVSSASGVKPVYDGLLARPYWNGMGAIKNQRVLLLSEELLSAPHLQTAAMLIIAKTAYPASFEDVEIDTALQMLVEEATGSLPTGIYYYDGQGGG